MVKKYSLSLVIKSAFLLVGISLFTAGPAKAQSDSELQDVQEIIAIVNDQVISLYDLKQRSLLLALAGGARDITPEEQRYFQTQAMEALIDDKLKLQEAVKYEADMPEADVLISYENYAKQFNVDSDELTGQLNEAGVEKETLLSQIRGSMAWSGVIFGLLEPQVSVTDDEVMNIIESLERNKGRDQYKVSEIFILVTDNARREDSYNNAKAIHEQLLEGAPFAGIARQFSQSSTATVGGDLDWIMENELPEVVDQAVRTMEIGDISEPIETEDGYYIMLVTDKRKILTLNESDINVVLKQIRFDKGDGSDAVKNALNERVMNEFQNTNACELNEEIAEKLGAIDTNEVGSFRLGQLPLDIRKELLSIEEGSGTRIFDDEEGFITFLLCEKNIPEIKLPEFDTVLENLTQSRLQLMARRHLRDLRRDAIIDYR